MNEIRNKDGLTEKEFLAQYNPDVFKHPSCTVDIILMTILNNKLNVLLVKRKDHPWINQWALPGGFVEMDEDLDETVIRELKEETNVSTANYFKQLYTFGKVDRDPRTRVLTTAYISLIPAGNIKDMHSGDDAEDAKWFEIEKAIKSVNENKRVSELVLYNKELDIKISYDITDTVKGNYIQKHSKQTSKLPLAADHIKSINMAMDELHMNVATSGLLFNLLPKKFTLKQVQETYEIVSGKTVDTRNFRKNITKMLIKTDEVVEGYNKPSTLYKFNPMFEYMKEDL